MTEDYKNWHLMPLEGKYYGTVVIAGNGAEITVWGDRCWKLSPREIEHSGPFDDDWSEAECMSDGHYEDLNDYKKACLIAAAPELLEALQYCTTWMEAARASGDSGFWEWSDGDIYSNAMKTIAKALGK